MAGSSRKTGLTVEQWPLDRVKPYPKNPRKVTDAAVAKVAASITEFGWRQPIVVDGRGVILAGHTRLLAAKHLGLDSVPVHVAKGLSAAQRKAYRLADNRTGEETSWDDGLLALELGDLQEFDFDLGLTGFDPAELDEVMGAKSGLTDPDDAPEPPERPVSRQGDIWLCGPHRLLCGDACAAAAVEALLGGATPDMVFTDPPYGISIVKGATVGGAKPSGAKGWVGGGPEYKIPFRGKRGRVHGRARKAIIEPGRYAPVIGDDSTETAVKAYRVCAGLGIKTLIFWGGNYYADELPASRCWLVWDKENTGTFADVELAWTSMDRPARLFRHQWSGLMKASERGQARVHPTQKPAALAAWCFTEFAPKEALVMDVFLGSGSTLIAAEQTGRRCAAMELSPAYVDVAARRWQDFAGAEATLEGDGRTFAEVAAERLEEVA